MPKSNKPGNRQTDPLPATIRRDKLVSSVVADAILIDAHSIQIDALHWGAVIALKEAA
jgi:exosome complex RNA-binding protein Rrp42 (RNase PH superfamily)